MRQRPVASVHPELWDAARSPIAFYAERRLVILAAPRVADGKAEVREYPIVVAGPRGSRVTFAADRLRVEGADETMRDVHEERGARVQDGRLRLRGRWDGLFLRVRDEARPRTLELRIAGEGTGTLYVGDWDLGAVRRFRPDGSELPPIGTSIRQPAGIALDRDRVLVVARGDDIVRVFPRTP